MAGAQRSQEHLGPEATALVARSDAEADDVHDLPVPADQDVRDELIPVVNHEPTAGADFPGERVLIEAVLWEELCV